MQRRTWAYLTALALLSVPYSLMATPLAEQALALSPSGFDSNLNHTSTQQMADSFSLAAAATLTDVEWFGHYFSLIPSTSVDFRVRLFTNTGGKPGTNLLDATLAVLGVDTGQDDSSNRSVLAYAATLTSGVALGAGTYWLSILEADATTGQTWSWSRTATAGLAFRTSEAAVWQNAGNPGLAFTLKDNSAASTAVPEPGTAVLLGTGLLGVWVCRRHWRG